MANDGRLKDGKWAQKQGGGTPKAWKFLCCRLFWFPKRNHQSIRIEVWWEWGIGQKSRAFLYEFKVKRRSRWWGYATKLVDGRMSEIQAKDENYTVHWRLGLWNKNRHHIWNNNFPPNRTATASWVYNSIFENQRNANINNNSFFFVPILNCFSLNVASFVLR